MKKTQFIKKKKDDKEKGTTNTLQNLCNEEKYFMKRKKEGNINVIHVL